MQRNLTVDVNPNGMHTLAVPERFGTEGAFDVVLKNHGEPTHVYLNLDDGLSDGATLDATNYYVEQGETLPITISVSSNTTVSGELTVATAYGGEKRLVSVTVEPTQIHTDNGSAQTTHARTASDASASSPSQFRSGSESTPPSASPPTASIDEQLVRRTLPAIVFGAVAIILALSSLLVTGAPRIVLGLLAILAGVFLTVYLAVV